MLPTVSKLCQGKAADSIQAVNTLEQLIMVHLGAQLQDCACHTSIHQGCAGQLSKKS